MLQIMPIFTSRCRSLLQLGNQALVMRVCLEPVARRGHAQSSASHTPYLCRTFSLPGRSSCGRYRKHAQ